MFDLLVTCTMHFTAFLIKHIRAKPSALSQNTCQLLTRMRRCIRVIISTRARDTRAILISYSRPRPAPLGAGRGREYEV